MEYIIGALAVITTGSLYLSTYSLYRARVADDLATNAHARIDALRKADSVRILPDGQVRVSGYREDGDYFHVVFLGEPDKN